MTGALTSSPSAGYTICYSGVKERRGGEVEKKVVGTILTTAPVTTFIPWALHSEDKRLKSGLRKKKGVQ